jgi:hypothetical protein
MAKSPSQTEPDIATRIMERMVRMPPKQHKDMKVGRAVANKQQSRAKTKKISDARE